MSGVRSLAEAKDFSCSLCVQTSSAAHPASYSVWTGGPFLWVKCSRGIMMLTIRPLSSAEVRNEDEL
jgi:hypothetical protein